MQIQNLLILRAQALLWDLVPSSHLLPKKKKRDREDLLRQTKLLNLQEKGLQIFTSLEKLHLLGEGKVLKALSKEMALRPVSKLKIPT